MSLYDIPINRLDGSPSSLADFQGKAVLAVNVASKCGLTPQYDGLEKLYSDYKDKGLVVLGVPCNQFGGQEPGADEEIAEFCERNFGVSFPLTSKANVLGKEQHPLFAELTRDESGQPVKVKWNFEKFVINRDGELVARFPSTVEPDAQELVDAVEKALS